ncbi:hypothetical protein SNEBB_011424 [Seison nebaliae]|nr:hypothetical protein SNEBB_011424 [Seison nebaliae]
MTTSLGTNKYNRSNWEVSNFPILCETCLGDNPYVRMQRDARGAECKICQRPFTTFRWCPGARMRFKQTEICQTCAKVKNVCQTCLLDLRYGLPVEVRDAALNLSNDNEPTSDVNREYYLQNVEREMGEKDSAEPVSKFNEKDNPVLKNQNDDMLLKLARTQPYYKRNRPHICSFFVKGECGRGEECPYRHEKPGDPDDPLTDQNLRDRYYGIRDPVAAKLLNAYKSMPKLEKPSDRSVTSLYVGNIGLLSENKLKNYFCQYGQIQSVTMQTKSSCAFVQFKKREDAEYAADATFNKLQVDGKRLTIKWKHSPNHNQTSSFTSSSSSGNIRNNCPVPNLAPVLPAPGVTMINFQPSSGKRTSTNMNDNNKKSLMENQHFVQELRDAPKDNININENNQIYYDSQNPDLLT